MQIAAVFGVDHKISGMVLRILPLHVDFINDNVSATNPILHSQNSLYSQSSICIVYTYEMLDKGCLL